MKIENLFACVRAMKEQQKAIPVKKYTINIKYLKSIMANSE
jgi:hypothetical protein